MQETTAVSILVQAGAVGIAFGALYIIYKMQNGQRKEQSDVIERNTQAFIAFMDSNTKHSAAIDRLTEAVSRDRRRN